MIPSLEQTVTAAATLCSGVATTVATALILETQSIMAILGIISLAITIAGAVWVFARFYQRLIDEQKQQRQMLLAVVKMLNYRPCLKNECEIFQALHPNKSNENDLA